MALFESASEERLDDTLPLKVTFESTETADEGHTVYVLCVERGWGGEKKRWKVRKRFKEFEALDQALSASGISLPLPPKKIVGNKKREFIAERLSGLQTFLCAVLRNHCLTTTFPVKSFLDPTSYPSDFKQKVVQEVSLELRSLHGWTLKDRWDQPGWRIRKGYYTVALKGSKEPYVLNWNPYGPDFNGDKASVEAVLDFLKGVQPYLWMPEHASSGASGIVAIRSLLKEGSLRDQMSKAKPKDDFLKKQAAPKGVFLLQIEDLRQVARHVLQALRFIRTIGLPYGHLHCGNLAILGSGCHVMDVESGLAGMPSYYRSFFVQFRSITTCEDIDVYCFGQTLYEMAVGEPLNQPSLTTIPSEIPRCLHHTLQSILSAEALRTKLPTLDDLLQDPVFAGAPCSVGPTECRIPSRVKEFFTSASQRILQRLLRDRENYIQEIKSQKMKDMLNSTEQKNQRRKLMKQRSLKSTEDKADSLIPPANGIQAEMSQVSLDE